MTIEELRLRVMAAFPSGAVSCLVTAMDDVIVCRFDDPIDLETAARPLEGLVASMQGGDVHASADFKGPGRFRDHEMAGPEIVRRILAVTAHDLIAARRRLLADAAASV